MTRKFKDMDMYNSAKEPGGVAFDIIRLGKSRQYIRIAPGGMGFLNRGMGDIKIIGVDCYESETS